MMNAIQKAVLARLVSDKDASAASAEVPAGKHEVDFTLRVTGEFGKGVDHEQEIWNKVDYPAIAVVLLEKLRQAGLEVDMSEVVKLSLTDEIKGKAKEASAEVKAIHRVVQAPTLTPCNGKITGVKKLTVEVVESGKGAELEPASA